ncbi:putative TPR repeat-containing protein [Rosellinia necatrix]|uniref:Putative TPR repeat-containing protein n=1 Tax=Rosellinia necatrix TaxID=77044 RepID=A0A1W2TKA5_ROSNE|nr:putative TPR repeat-containing protein [Rosellinia necatrix]
MSMHLEQFRLDSMAPTHPIQPPTATVDKISITRVSYDSNVDVACPNISGSRRRWTVSVTVNDKVLSNKTTLVDPLPITEYGDCINPGTESVKVQTWCKNYFDSLVSQLGLERGHEVYHGLPRRQISIHERPAEAKGDGTNATHESSIFSLYWEILESVHLWQPCALAEIRLCRVWEFRTTQSGLVAQRPSLLPTDKEEFRILLVISRSFRQDMERRYRDYRPSLILGPLLKIAQRRNQLRCLPRVQVDVVRPGTLQHLERKLEERNTHPYDIVHLDMHGKIERKCVPPVVHHMTYLRFAKRYNSKLVPFRTRDPMKELMENCTSLRDVEAVDVARLFQKYNVSSVALSSCYSSYAQGKMLANMGHVFLSHGVSHVSAMSFKVRAITAGTYYDAFYKALLIKGQTFLGAAAAGRRALRGEPSDSALSDALVPTNYHVLTRVSTSDFRPRSHLQMTAVWLILAHWLPCVAVTFTGLWVMRSKLPKVPLAALVWYVWAAGLVMYVLIHRVRQLTCPLWIWNPREQQRGHGGYVEIEHLVLEDCLAAEANRGALYLWCDKQEAGLGEVVERLARVWVRTGFFDAIDMISARIFSSPLSTLRWWLWLWTTRYRSEGMLPSSLDQRQLVVITDFDGLYESLLRSSHTRGSPPPKLKDALECMSRFIAGYMRGEFDSRDSKDVVDKTDDNNDISEKTHEGPYIIITGSFNAERWRKMSWEGDTMQNIGRAVPHKHNVKPSACAY